MSKNKRVLLISNRYPSPSKPYAGWYVAAHEEIQTHEGWEFRKIYYSPSNSLLLKILKLIPYLWKVLWSTLFARFELIHAHWIVPSGLAAAIIGWVRDKPFIVTSHGAHIEEYDQMTGLMQFLVCFVLQRANMVIPVGVDHCQKIIQACDISSDKLTVVDMGVRIPEKLQSKNEARRALGLDPKGEIVVFIGNLMPNKGPDILIESARILVEIRPSIRFEIVGQGLLEDYLRSLVSKYDLKDSIRFRGAEFPENVYTWLYAADVCVVPSRRESFGLISIEAMACGAAVIAADVGNLSHNIVHGKNGLLFRLEDPDDLAEKINQLIGNPELRAVLSQNGREFANQFNIEARARTVLEVFDEVLAESHPRSSD